MSKRKEEQLRLDLPVPPPAQPVPIMEIDNLPVTRYDAKEVRLTIGDMPLYAVYINEKEARALVQYFDDENKRLALANLNNAVDDCLNAGMTLQQIRQHFGGKK